MREIEPSYRRHQYTCVKCARVHEASSGQTYASVCRCGNILSVVIEEIGCAYVMAESAEAAERAAKLYRNVSKRGDEKAMAAFRMWEGSPIPLRHRNNLYAVRRFFVVDNETLDTVSKVR